jgi:large subunit ribosomal protein L2
MVDFYFHDKKSIPAKVETIEYDPYRTAWIALVCYKDGERRYVVAHTNMKVGDVIVTDDKAPLERGNRLLVSNIPVGMNVYNVELIVGQGNRRECGIRVQSPLERLLASKRSVATHC